MPLPTSIKRLFSFTGFQQGQGDNSFPGTNLDADLDQTNTVVNGLLASVASVLRPDGRLAAGSVWRGALGSDILLGVGPSKPWSANIAYIANADTVTRANKVYLCIVSNTGVDPALDVTQAYWLQTADVSQAVVVADGSIGTTSFTDKAVTEPKLADGAVSNRALGTGAVAKANAAVSLGVVPVGAEIDYAGFLPPPGWLFSAGQAVSRTIYADLFNAITFAFDGAGTVTSDNRIRLGGSDLSGFGIIGAVAEGPGIPPGAVVVDAVPGSVGLSVAATATGTILLRILPYGRGDGSSTFNVPDRRGRISAGRDNMGGTAAGRFGNIADGNNLARSVGAPTNTLANANLPANLPAGSVTVSYPAQTCYIRNNSIGASTGAGSATVSDLWQGVAQTSTIPGGPQTFAVSQDNPGGGTPFGVLQPTAIVNRLIFAGV